MSEVFLGRQPILNASSSLFGYELLYRNGLEEFAPGSDGDLASAWGGSWTAYTDSVAPGGKSTGEIELADGTLELTGEVSEGFQWGAWSGLDIAWDPEKKVLVDATGFEGIRLRVRGSERPYTLTVNRAAVKDYNVFFAPLLVKPEWTEIDVPFASLRQIGFGQSVEWSANDITGLNVDARNNPMGEKVFGPFELEIDWIRLY